MTVDDFESIFLTLRRDLRRFAVVVVCAVLLLIGLHAAMVAGYAKFEMKLDRTAEQAGATGNRD